MNQAQKKYKNSPKGKEADKRYWVNHKEEILKKRKEKYKIMRRRVIEAYGGKCACCGEKIMEFLTIDHIKGIKNSPDFNGKTRQPNSTYRYLIRKNFPPGYRILCMNCNSSLGHYGYCPHSKLQLI